MLQLIKLWSKRWQGLGLVYVSMQRCNSAMMSLLTLSGVRDYMHVCVCWRSATVTVPSFRCQGTSDSTEWVSVNGRGRDWKQDECIWQHIDRFMINILWTNTFHSVYLCSPAFSHTSVQAWRDRGSERKWRRKEKFWLLKFFDKTALWKTKKTKKKVSHQEIKTANKTNDKSQHYKIPPNIFKCDSTVPSRTTLALLRKKHDRMQVQSAKDVSSKPVIKPHNSFKVI